MEALAALLPVLRALIDAAFSSGGISDAIRNDLHGKLDKVDPAVDQAAATAPPLNDSEKAMLEQLQAKQDAATAASAENAPPLPAADVPTPSFGSESFPGV